MFKLLELFEKNVPLNKFEESNVPQISNTLKYFVELIFGYHSSHLHIH